MVTSGSILWRLRNRRRYLDRFARGRQPDYFEHLVTQTFAHILHLPFYASDDDDPSETCRVKWLGRIADMSKAPRGPDGVAFAYGFCAVIEATLLQNAQQWRSEFAQCLRHCEQFIADTGMEPRDVYVVFVAPELHVDTYRSLRHPPRPEFGLVALEVLVLARILETSTLALTALHLQVRRLLDKLLDCPGEASSLEDYRNLVSRRVKEWEEEILQREKTSFVALKSYEAMRRIARPIVSTGQILQELQGDRSVERYFRKLHARVGPGDIEKSLVCENLGYPGEKIRGERMFSPVSYLDFKGRAERMIKAVEEIYG